MNLLFADTETTGSEEEDRLCQLACKCGGLEINELFKPPLPISCGAMAVHHITNEMVEDKPPFIGSKEHTLLKGFSDRSIFIAHNAPFDVAMLAKEGLHFPRVIDTLKLARHFDTKGSLESHSLQYMRYKLGLYKLLPEGITAHDAWGDIVVLQLLFDRLAARVCKELGGVALEDAFVEMIRISSNPVILRRLSFGKHKGKLTADVAREDPGWLRWFYKQVREKPEQEADWIHTIEHYLGPM